MNAEAEERMLRLVNDTVSLFKITNVDDLIIRFYQKATAEDIDRAREWAKEGKIKFW